MDLLSFVVLINFNLWLFTSENASCTDGSKLFWSVVVVSISSFASVLSWLDCDDDSDSSSVPLLLSLVM